MRLLLSSFGPFGQHAVNASSEVALRLASEGIDGVDLVTIELPVARRISGHLLVTAFERSRPDAAVMLGIAESRAAITPERVAINVDDYPLADNEGETPADEPIVAGAAAAYFSTLPVRAIVTNLSAAGIPAGISNSAGTYLCNHVFYTLRYHVDMVRSSCRTGFIHIPQMREAVENDAPSLPLDTLVLGVRIAIETVASSPL